MKNKKQTINLNSNIQQGFILIFLNPTNNYCIFLAKDADIQSICYAERPYIPGTKDPKLAKFYPDIDSIKSDIYMLRYYHREFLNIKAIIKPIIKAIDNDQKNEIKTNSKKYYLDTFKNLSEL